MFTIISAFLQGEQTEDNDIDDGDGRNDSNSPSEPSWIVDFGQGETTHDGTTSWSDQVD